MIFDCLLLIKLQKEHMIVKIILLALVSPLILFSLTAKDKTQYFVELSFNSSLALFLKDLKLLVCAISELKSVASYLE